MSARDQLGAIDQEIADIHDRSVAAKERLITAMKAADLKVVDPVETNSLIAMAESELDRFNLAMDQADRMEAFRLFAGMAQHGQVIYLTHHRHLTDIAR